jgi:ABC-2 type transport system permease protein
MIGQYRQMWLVMRREISERFRTRVFQVSTVLVVVLSATGVAAAVKLPEMLEKGPAKVGTIGAVPAGFAEALTTAQRQIDFEIETVAFSDKGSAEQALSRGKVSALLKNGGEIVFDKSADEKIESTLNQAVHLAGLPQRLSELGITADQLQSIVKPEPLPTTFLDASATGDSGEPTDAEQAVAYGAVFLLLISASIYGNIVLTGVVEEKSSRVVEVLLGTLRPVDLLIGKVAGILIVGLTQLAAGLAAGLGALIVVCVPASMPDATFETIAVAVGSFLLGLTFFSLIYAAVGSTVSHAEQASNAPLPIAVFVGAVSIISMSLLTQPESPLLRVLSILPPTSVFLMPQRVAIGDPPLFQVIGAGVLMIGAIWAMARASGRIYAGAILSGGQSVRLLTAWRSSGE